MSILFDEWSPNIKPSRKKTCLRLHKKLSDRRLSLKLQVRTAKGLGMFVLKIFENLKVDVHRWWASNWIKFEKFCKEKLLKIWQTSTITEVKRSFCFPLTSQFDVQSHEVDWILRLSFNGWGYALSSGWKELELCERNTEEFSHREHPGLKQCVDFDLFVVEWFLYVLIWIYPFLLPSACLVE